MINLLFEHTWAALGFIAIGFLVCMALMMAAGFIIALAEDWWANRKAVSARLRG